MAAVEMKDGRVIEVGDASIDQIVRNSGTVIPALPGFTLLEYSYHPGIDEPGPWVSENTVIAWRTGLLNGVEPVVVDMDFGDMSSFHGILEPDGRVQTFERSYADRVEWEADMKMTIDADFARRLSTPARIEQ